MKKIILFLFLIFSICNSGFAEIRYVSHSGSNTPPYLTWETAADSIMFAINISTFGDTIYVANGVYKEIVDMIDGLTLIGAGSDSCIIDTRNFPLTAPFYSIDTGDSSYVSGFSIFTYNTQYGSGISQYNSVVEYCKIQAAHYGIDIYTGYQNKPRANKNIILNCEYGVYTAFAQSIIQENFVYISGIGTGLAAGLNSRATFINNTVICNSCTEGFYAGMGYQSKLYNNLFYGKGSDGIWTYGDSIKNNIIFGKDGTWDTGIIGWGADIRNNDVQNAQKGLDYIMNSTPIIFQYNNLWNNQTNYQNYTADSTNIYTDPMFNNPDSMDFHLQMFSPLIDAGDPDILDKNGTRSDIGLYGGPYGELYQYQDLPPRVPVNLTASLDTNYILLTWNKNTESDFSHYNLFRDTTENFTADSTTFVASIPDTFYLHLIPQGIDNLYFKLTAVDNQGNESEPSEELHVFLTGIVNIEEFIIDNYRLYQNYPNPFNPSTKIGYRLKERGYVKLYVYDIKGELIETLVNKYQEGGYYEVGFNASESGNSKSGIHKLASGIYIYQMMVRNEQNIPVFTDIKKMIYLK